MNAFSRFFPLAVVLAAAAYLGVSMAPERTDGPMHLDEFGKLPVVDRGRVKPFDTFARTSLMVVNGGRQTFRDEDGKRQPAVKWVLDVMTSRPDLKPDAAVMNYRVFRIENDQVLNLLGLEPRVGRDPITKKEIPTDQHFRYSLAEIAPKIGELDKQANRARNVQRTDPDKLDAFDRKLIELAEHLQLYIQLSQRSLPLTVPPKGANEEWKSFAEARQDAGASGDAKNIAFAKVAAEAQRLGIDLKQLDKLSDEQRDRFVMLFRTEMEQARQQASSPALKSLDAILQAYEDGKPDRFNQAVADYRQLLDQAPPAGTEKAGFEVFFNHFAPFYQCEILYVGVFLLVCGAWLSGARPVFQAAFWLTALTLAVHTWALAARMAIQGRPPVTNLYSSAVFIGWGCVILGMILEAIYRNGLGTAVAAVLGFVTVLISHFLAGSGDTLEMMQAVLDTNFWLATHVTCVTLGYTATFVAGFLSIAFILLGVFTPKLTRDLAKTLGQMIYGVVCFATLLSFTGTVLGGIWADYSWGRFWGWDPKENGALMIVIWNALILHARWGGLVQQRGMAVLAVFGNVITAWSWFGVNMLNVGLHSYGPLEMTGLLWLLGFMGSQLTLVGVGLLPTKWWWSFAAQRQEMTRPPAPPRQRHDGPAVLSTR